MNAKGTFEVEVHAEPPPHDVADGVAIARATVEKRFAGPLDGTSRVEMTSARTPVDGSAGSVGIERVTGTLAGRRGAFVFVHQGLMTRGASSLSVQIVPDSGTGELAGIRGRMDIQIVEGRHCYDLDYEIVDPS